LLKIKNLTCGKVKFNTKDKILTCGKIKFNIKNKKFQKKMIIFIKLKKLLHYEKIFTNWIVCNPKHGKG
jgi:hypothetical protein